MPLFSRNNCTAILGLSSDDEKEVVEILSDFLV